VKALVDPAVVIVAMVVPALDSQLLQEILDHSFPQEGDPDSVYSDSM
jgi:hypothetical protein